MNSTTPFLTASTVTKSSRLVGRFILNVPRVKNFPRKIQNTRKRRTLEEFYPGISEMACGSVSGVIFLFEPWMPSVFPSKNVRNFPPHKKISAPAPNCGCKIVVSDKSYRSARNCSNSGNPSTLNNDSEQEPPQEAVLKAISEVSKTEGRIRQTTNMVIGGTATDDSTNEWLALDQKVNSYPTVRGFMEIGTGGDDFVHAMVYAVESVLQKPVPEGLQLPRV